MPRAGLAAVNAWQMCAEHWTLQKWGAYGGAGAGGRGGGKDLEEALAGREGRAEGREASLLGVTGANTECAHV